MSDIINLDKFRNALIEPTRNNRFRVHFELLTDLPFLKVDEKLYKDTPFFVQSTALPGIVNSSIEVNFAGYTIEYAGNVEPGSWNSTFINDVNHKAYRMIEAWMTLKHDVKTNRHGVATGYHRDIFISQLDNSGNPIATWFLKAAHPKSLGEMSKEQNGNEIDTFDVEWAYSYRIVTFGEDSLEKVQALAKEASEQSIEILADTVQSPVS